MPDGITPGGRGRFDGFDVLAQAHTWDDVTRRVVLARLEPPPPLRFFTAEEAPTVRTLLDLLLAQDDVPLIPVLREVDAKLADGRGDGWRHREMPEDGRAWRRSLAGLDADARERGAAGLHALDPASAVEVLESVRTADEWRGMPGRWVWDLWTRYACPAFYSHPWAWNEIGFGGPAYPRGYKALGIGGREPWERSERDAHDPAPWAERLETARRAGRQ